MPSTSGDLEKVVTVVTAQLPPGPGQPEVLPVAAAQVHHRLPGGESGEELGHPGPGLVSGVGEVTGDLLVDRVDQLALQEPGGLLQASPGLGQLVTRLVSLTSFPAAEKVCHLVQSVPALPEGEGDPDVPVDESEPVLVVSELPAGQSVVVTGSDPVGPAVAGGARHDQQGPPGQPHRDCPPLRTSEGHDDWAGEREGHDGVTGTLLTVRVGRNSLSCSREVTIRYLDLTLTWQVSVDCHLIRQMF